MLGGAMKIADLDVKEKFQVVNMDRLQKYNPWKKEKKSLLGWNPKGRPRKN